MSSSTKTTRRSSTMRPLAPAPSSRPSQQSYVFSTSTSTSNPNSNDSLPLIQPRPTGKPAAILAKSTSSSNGNNGNRSSSSCKTKPSPIAISSKGISISNPKADPSHPLPPGSSSSSSDSTSTSSNDPVTPITASANGANDSFLPVIPSEKKSGGMREDSSSLVKPQKEWVLPQRAKPGRKPSQVEPPTKRKAQNRASQRAFRERKQDYLASLEQKVQAYENAEVSKTIELQKIARGVNEENEKLKQENSKLRIICQDLQSELKRWTEEFGSLDARGKSNSKKRNFSGCKAPSHESQSSSISMNEESHWLPGFTRHVEVKEGWSGRSPGSSNSGESFPLDGTGPSTSKLRSLSLESNPNLDQHHHQVSDSTSPPASSPTQRNGLFRSKSNQSSSGYSGGGLKPRGTDTDRDCGFCTESSPCVCAGEADLNLNEVEKIQTTISVGSLLGPSSSPGYPSNKLRINYGQNSGGRTQSIGSKGASKPKLWEVHPPPSSARAKLWPTVPARFSNIQADPSISNPTWSKSESFSSASLPCSGDPSTCSACSKDPALAAFCEAISRNLEGTLSSPAILDVGNSVRIRSRSQSQSSKMNSAEGAVEGQERSTSHDNPLQRSDVSRKLWPSLHLPSSNSSFLANPSRLSLNSSPSLSTFSQSNPDSTSSFVNHSSRPLPPLLPNRKETIPEAWAQLRSHPRFNQWGGGLSLLADVVSGRTSSSQSHPFSSGSGPGSVQSQPDLDLSERRRRAPSVEIKDTDDRGFSVNSSSSRPILQRKLSVTRGTTSERNGNGSSIVDSRLKLAPLSSSLEDSKSRGHRRSDGNGSLGKGNDGDDGGEDSEMKDLNQRDEIRQSNAGDGEGEGRGMKRRRLYVETDAVRDALALLDRGLPPREEAEEGNQITNDNEEVQGDRRLSLPCPCPWKPST